MSFFLNEAYQGKPKKLIEIEKKLDSVCQYFKFNDSKATIDDTNIILAQIEKEFADLFGFSNVFLTIAGRPKIIDFWDYNSKSFNFGNPRTIYRILENTQTVNAYTIIPFTALHSINLANTNSIILKDGVYRYKEPLPVLYIAVYQELFRKLTGGQVLSVILHEVGHNFYQYRTTLGNLYNVYRAGYGLLALASSIIYDYAASEVLYRLPILSFVTKIIDGVAAVISKGIELVMSNEVGETIMEFNILVNRVASLRFVLGSKLGYNLKRLALVHIREGHSQEKFADEFASMLGYATESSEAQVIMSGYDLEKKAKNKNIVYSVMHSINITIEAMLAQFGPHPDSFNRINNNIKYLEKEKSNAKSEKLKKMIQLEIDNNKVILDAYKNNVNKSILLDDADIRPHLDKVKEKLETFVTMGYKNPPYDTSVLDYLTKFKFKDVVPFLASNTENMEKGKKIGKDNMLSGYL